MVRGTTPTLTFRLPFDTEIIGGGYITFAQNGSTVLELTENDVSMDGNEISVTLTQEQTLAFKSYDPVEIQIRVVSTGGKALASNVMRTSVGRILKEGVI